MDQSEFSASKKFLKNGPRGLLDHDPSPWLKRKQRGKTLLPQRIGNRSLHIVAASVCFNSTHAKCISCQRSQRLSNFWLADDVNDLATSRNFVLDARCNKCRTLERNTVLSDADGYTPELDCFWTENFRSLCAGARSRKIEITITKDALLERYLRNEGRCEMTGVLLKPERGKTNRLAPSVDRIDSKRHYSKGNIQIVARCINLMKGDMETDEFVEWCKRIAKRKI